MIIQIDEWYHIHSLIRNNIAYHDFTNWRFPFHGASGSYIWGSDENRYLDFSSGWNVANLGWNNPEVQDAVIQQVEKNVYAPIWTSDPIQESYATQLLKHMPEGMDTICRATNGTEAIEMALKLARAITGKKKIIGFMDSYHGQLFASMSLGFDSQDIASIGPLVPSFLQIPYPEAKNTHDEDSTCLEKFTVLLNKVMANNDIAGIVCEPEMITGWGSCKIAIPGFTKTVRAISQEHGALMILDEVGTGFSRIGRLFGYEHSGIDPDIITLAKGIANGAGVIGAVVTKSYLVANAISQTHLTSTFGWAPIACAAALKTLELHLRNQTWTMARNNGNYLQHILKSELSKTRMVKDIRGLGLEIAIEFHSGIALSIMQEAFKRGLHVPQGGTHVMQIMPPLTISRQDLDLGLDILIQSILAVQNV